MTKTQSTNLAMTDNLLFEQFATLATAPDGIARLRELILQLAVQGKFGTQDAEDEPASVLLERLRKEKEQLQKEEKIKRDKHLEPVKSSDVGFQIPDTWALTRLGNIAQYNAETKTSANEISEEAWVFDLEDIEKDTSRILQKVRFKDRQSLSTKSRFRKGDILYGKLRPYLNKVVVADEDGYCTTEIVPIRPYAKICPKYLMYALKTPDFLSYVNSKTYGIKMPRLGTVDALNTIIPLPPLAEQHRIVAKVDRLMALCDELEARQQQEREGCLKLGTASLAGLQNATQPEEFGRLWAQVCEAFDLILDCPENVAVLRQTILQLAVQGRLVRQEPRDEPASVLLERIRREKVWLINEGQIKTDGKYDPVKPYHFPYPMPEKWQWVRLGEITQKIGSGSTPRGGRAVYQEDGIKFIRSQNVWNDGLYLERVARISNEIHQAMNSTLVQPRDILLNITGASIGRSCIVPDNFDEGNVNQHVSIIRTVDENVRLYLHYCIISSYFQNRIMDVQVGMSREGLSKKVLKDLLIPFPPLAEQHRIVAKVDALMALCDELEARLKERAVVQGKLAGAVARQVVG